MTTYMPLAKIELGGKHLFYVGFSVNEVFDTGEGAAKNPRTCMILKEYESSVPVDGHFDVLDGKFFETGPGYVLDKRALIEFLESKSADAGQIVRDLGDKLNLEKIRDLNEIVSSCNAAISEIYRNPAISKK